VSAAKGRLKDKELWVFTDNWTYEGAFVKGCCTSGKLMSSILGGFEVDDEQKEMFMHGRDGDHAIGVCFECYVCSFKNTETTSSLIRSGRQYRGRGRLGRQSKGVRKARCLPLKIGLCMHATHQPGQNGFKGLFWE